MCFAAGLRRNMLTGPRSWLERRMRSGKKDVGTAGIPDG